MKVIVDVKNFQALIVDHMDVIIKIDKIVEPFLLVKPFGVQVDNKLNYNLCITKTCKSAGNQPNADLGLFV